MIHTRKTTVDYDDGVQHWVSLDGEHWLPVNRAPDERTTEKDIQALFDGDGNFKPLTFARTYIDRMPEAP